VAVFVVILGIAKQTKRILWQFKEN